MGTTDLYKIIVFAVMFSSGPQTSTKKNENCSGCDFFLEDIIPILEGSQSPQLSQDTSQ